MCTYAPAGAQHRGPLWRLSAKQRGDGVRSGAASACLGPEPRSAHEPRAPGEGPGLAGPAPPVRRSDGRPLLGEVTARKSRRRRLARVREPCVSHTSRRGLEGGRTRPAPPSPTPGATTPGATTPGATTPGAAQLRPSSVSVGARRSVELRAACRRTQSCSVTGVWRDIQARSLQRPVGTTSIPMFQMRKREVCPSSRSKAAGPLCRRVLFQTHGSQGLRRVGDMQDARCPGGTDSRQDVLILGPHPLPTLGA